MNTDKAKRLIETVLDQARRIRPAVVPALAVPSSPRSLDGCVSHLGSARCQYAEVAALCRDADLALAIALGCTAQLRRPWMVY